MLKLQQIEKMPYVQYGNVQHIMTLVGTNTTSALVTITHNQNEVEGDKVKVDITHPDFLGFSGQDLSECFDNLPEAVRWAETKVNMEFSLEKA
jgi:hypothetical protein